MVQPIPIEYKYEKKLNKQIKSMRLAEPEMATMPTKPKGATKSPTAFAMDEKLEDTNDAHTRITLDLNNTSPASAGNARTKYIMDDMHTRIAARAKYKFRSHDTHHSKHMPALLSSEQYDVVLLGASGIERLLTTGAATPLNKRPSTLNLGVGGDNLENILYRLGRLPTKNGLCELFEHRRNCRV